MVTAQISVKTFQLQTNYQINSSLGSCYRLGTSPKTKIKYLAGPNFNRCFKSQLKKFIIKNWLHYGFSKAPIPKSFMQIKA